MNESGREAGSVDYLSPDWFPGWNSRSHGFEAMPIKQGLQIIGKTCQLDGRLYGV